MKKVIETVEIRVGTPKYSVPKDHPIVERERTDDAGNKVKVKYWTFDVEYIDPETVGDLSSKEFIEQVMLGMDSTDEKDYVKACKAGIRLAIGDAAKAVYREDGGGRGFAAKLNKASQWAAMNEDDQFLMTWRTMLKTDKVEANKWLVARFENASK